MRWLRRYWPVLAWAGAIWIFSTASFSSEHTGRFIMPLLHWLLPQASADTLERTHFFIRKFAHLVEYSIFGLLVLHAIRDERKGWQWRWGLITIAVAAGYAAVDELHQAFVPTRGPSVWDVGLDTLGAAFAQLCAAWWWLHHRRSPQPERVELRDGAPPAG